MYVSVNNMNIAFVSGIQIDNIEKRFLEEERYPKYHYLALWVHQLTEVGRRGMMRAEIRFVLLYVHQSLLGPQPKRRFFKAVCQNRILS
jgi:hypothetical protein